MHVGVVEYHDVEIVFLLLCNELFEGVDNMLGRDVFLGCLIDDLATPIHESQDVQTLAVGKRLQAGSLANGTPAIGNRGALGKAGFVEVKESGNTLFVPFLQGFQARLSIAKGCFITLRRQTRTGAFVAEIQLFFNARLIVNRLAFLPVFSSIRASTWCI